MADVPAVQPPSRIAAPPPPSSRKAQGKERGGCGGAEKPTFHDYRRIFLNKLRERGVSLETAMVLTAHKSVVTVMNHYREVPEAELQEAVAAASVS